MIWGRAFSDPVDTANLGDQGMRLQGAGTGYAGISVAGLGDLNGDGLADVGCPATTTTARRPTWSSAARGTPGT